MARSLLEKPQRIHAAVHLSSLSFTWLSTFIERARYTLDDLPTSLIPVPFNSLSLEIDFLHEPCLLLLNSQSFSLSCFAQPRKPLIQRKDLRIVRRQRKLPSRIA